MKNIFNMQYIIYDISLIIKIFDILYIMQNIYNMQYIIFNILFEIYIFQCTIFNI